MKYNTKLLTVAFATWSGMAFAGGNIEQVPTEVNEPTAPLAQVTIPYYIGLGASAVSVRSEESTLNFFEEEKGQDRIGTIGILAGYAFNRSLSLEGRYSVSVAKEDRLKMDNMALYLKPQYPVSEEVSVYALLGYGKVTLDEVKNSGINGDKSGFQWGLGASYQITEEVSLFAEYTVLGRNLKTDLVEDRDIDSVNVGVTYRF